MSKEEQKESSEGEVVSPEQNETVETSAESAENITVDQSSTADDKDKIIADLEAELSELKDQYLRKSADFENYRKRMIREKEESIKYSNSALIGDLVPVIDDFERAIKSSAESRDFDSFYSGIELIEKQLVGMLERNWGLKRFESAGEEFDPQKHEALHMEESTEHETQVVLEDYQKGYMLHDRVLRHSKVKVAMPKQKEESSEEE